MWPIFLALLTAMPAAAQRAPDAVTTDPPIDAVHPAKMAVVHIPTRGLKINGVLYLAAGAGPHPTLVFFHGLPGNEQNLDLAQAIRRAGWNVLTLHYRGSWGSPGVFSYQHLLDDGAAATAFVRDPANARAYDVDINRVVLAGHSTGGLVAAFTAARTQGLHGLVLISASDDAAEAEAARRDGATWRRWVKETYADSMETLAGCTPDGLAAEVLAHRTAWSFAVAAPKLTKIPVLVITADDGLAPEGERLAAAIHTNGGATPTLVHMTTDHPYSDHRIALQSAVIAWLQAHDQH